MKRVLAVILAGAMALSLTACGGSSNKDASGSSAAGSAAVTMSEITGSGKSLSSTDTQETTAVERVIDESKSRKLVVGTDKEPYAQAPWDPERPGSNTCNVMTCNIYEGAFEVNKDGSISPLLATHYEVNDDYTEWTIYFRDNIYFSNGDHMTADDVIWSYDNMAACSNSASLWVNYDHTEKIDDYTVKVVLSEPFMALSLSAIAGRVGLIQDKAYYDQVGLDGYKANPVGTGPYILSEVKLNDYQVYTKNPNYWNKENVDVFYEEIRVKFLTDQNTQMLALENNEIDVLLNAKLPPLLMLPESSDIKFDLAQASGVSFLLFNSTGNNPCKDVNIRRAIASCMDRDILNSVIYEGYSAPAYYIGASFFMDAPKDEDITVKLPEYDLEAAKEYLKAGNYNGETVNLLCISGTEEEQAAQILQGELLKIGVNCEVKSLDSASAKALQKMPDGWDVRFYTGTSSAMDFSWQRQFLCYNDLILTGNHVIIPNDAEYEQLWKDSNLEFDHEARSKIFARMQSIINENVWACAYLNRITVTAFHDRVKGVEGRPIEYLYQFKYWY